MSPTLFAVLLGAGVSLAFLGFAAFAWLTRDVHHQGGV